MSADIDVLICVGSADIHRLMSSSVKSCLRHFEPLGNIYIVSNAVSEVRLELERQDLRSPTVAITVIDDREILSPKLMALPGWCRQQIIRLRIDQICSTSLAASLSADTVLCRPVTRTDLFEGASPILYFNRYQHTSSHLDYERRRVRNVAQLLRVEPVRSLPLGDFIMDLKLLEASHLRLLRDYLNDIYGDEAFLHILPQRCESLEDKVTFGEWTLYAVFLLDVLRVDVPIRNSHNRFITQIHSERELALFRDDAHVVHFVDKSLDLTRITPLLAKWGVA